MDNKIRFYTASSFKKITIIIVIFHLLQYHTSTAFSQTANLSLVDTVVSTVSGVDTLFVNGVVIITDTLDIGDHLVIRLGKDPDITIEGVLLHTDDSELTLEPEELPFSSRPILRFVDHGGEQDVRLKSVVLQNIYYEELDRNLLDTFHTIGFYNYNSLKIAGGSMIDNGYVGNPNSLDRTSGSFTINNVDSIWISNFIALRNKASLKAASLDILTADYVNIFNYRAASNLARNTIRDTIIIDGTPFFRFISQSAGSSSLSVDDVKVCVLQNSFFTADSSFYAVGLFCDSLYASNVYVGESNATQFGGDNGSGRRHVYEHCTLVHSTDFFTATGANNIFRNSIITLYPRRDGDRIPAYNHRFGGSTIYQNTAINYDPQGATGSINVPTDVVPRNFSVPLIDDASISNQYTPSINSALVDRAPMLQSVTTDLLGRSRDHGGLVDLGAFEQVSSVSITVTAVPAQVSVYPNPTRQEFTIEGLDIGSIVRLVNTKGQVVREIGLSTGQPMQVNLQNTVPSGMHYILVFPMQGSSFTIPVVVLK